MNYLAILVASVAAFLAGWLWYSPVLFGNIWMKEQKISKKDAKAAKCTGMVRSMIIGFLLTIVTAVVFSYLARWLSYTTAAQGAHLALIAWIGFGGTMSLNSVLWEGKSMKSWLINASHMLVSFLILAIIVTVWQ